jgi:hypothetical protein
MLRGEKITGVKCWCHTFKENFKSDEDKSGSRNRTLDCKYSWSINLDSLSVLFRGICHRLLLVYFRVFFLRSWPQNEQEIMWKDSVLWSRPIPRHLSGGLRKITTTLVSASGFELWASKLHSRSTDVRPLLSSQDKAGSYWYSCTDYDWNPESHWALGQELRTVSAKKSDIAVSIRSGYFPNSYVCTSAISEPVQSTLLSSGYDVCHHSGEPVPSSIRVV